MGVESIDTCPADVVGDPERINPTRQRTQAAKVIEVDRIHRAEIHRYTVQGNAVALANAVDDIERAPAIDHEIFRDDFDEVDGLLRRDEIGVMRNTQAQTEAMERGRRLNRHDVLRERSGRHRDRTGSGYCAGAVVLPPWAEHSFIETALKPWPLQSFWPLQAWLPDLQSEVPLQLLMP